MKQYLLSNTHKGINNSIQKGFHLEAITLIESVLAEHLEAAIQVVTEDRFNVNTLGASIVKALEINTITNKAKK